MNGAPAKVRLYKLRLPALRELRVGQRNLRDREVLRISVDFDDERAKRYADCSPLPFLHRESLDEVTDLAKQFSVGAALELPPSLATAMESLNYVDRPLSGDWENSALLTLGSVAPVEARVCKVKVRGGELAQLADYLRLLLEANPSREFRIDCNEGLDVTSLSLLQSLAREFPIAYFEEPVADFKTLKEMARVLPIALDENLGRDPELDGLAKAWVIKPNVLGWSQSLQRFRDPSPVSKILSNVYESAASLQLYAHAYFTFVDRPMALGFGTAFYFNEKNCEWDPRVWRGHLPARAFSRAPFSDEGVLLWEN